MKRSKSGLLAAVALVTCFYTLFAHGQEVIYVPEEMLRPTISPETRRLWNLSSVTNDNELADAAISDPDPGVRAKAVERLTNQTALADVAKNDLVDGLRRLAVEKLADTELLKSIAKMDKSHFVRRQAVLRLEDQGFLTEIARKDADRIVRWVASERIEDQGIRAEVQRELTNAVSGPGAEVVIPLGKDEGIVLCWIPAGEFQMGSPTTEVGRAADETQHLVKFNRGFWLGKYEITQNQWMSVMGTNSGFFYAKSGGPNSAMSGVSWLSCQRFLRTLNELKKSGNSFRFPTEAEWEYSCRAGTTTSHPIPSEGTLDDVAWWRHEGGRYDLPFVRMVGLKAPNAWGLCDMIGNAAEWCQDWYASYSDGTTTTDPSGPPRGNTRIYRGGYIGQWNSSQAAFRSACRNRQDPGQNTTAAIGLRIVMTE